MAKAKSVDVSDMLTPDQVASNMNFSDLYFIALPKETLLELNDKAKKLDMTLSQAIGSALSEWLKE